MHPSQTVLSSLITLNQLEEELKVLGPRSKRRLECAKSIKRVRGKIPIPILSHHDRVRAKGRRSTATVLDWICHGCHITIPIGLRQPLSQASDLFVCENCGSYIYLPDGTEKRPMDGQPLESNRSKKIAAVVAKKNQHDKVTPATKHKANTSSGDCDRIAMIRELMAKIRMTDGPKVPARKGLSAAAK